VGLAVVFAAGCAMPVPENTVNVAAAAAGLLLAIAGLFHRRRWSAWTLWPAVFLVSALHGFLSRPGVAPCDLVRQIHPRGENLPIVGRISDDPVKIETPEAEWRFVLAVEAIHREGERWQRARGTVRVRLFDPDDLPSPPAYGDRVRSVGPVKFDRDGRGDLVQHTAPGGFRPLSRGGNPWVRRCLAWRAAAARTLGRGLEDAPAETGIIRAMLLGLRADIPPEVREHFWMTGTMHVFAISGLHVGIVAFFCLALVRAAGIGRRYELFALAPLLAAYTAATGLASSAIRAALMSLAYVAATFFRRRPDAPSALAAAALVLLAADAREIADIGFLYSFMVVAGLFLFTPPLLRPWRRAWAAEDWRAQPPPFAERVTRSALRRAVSPTIVSLAAWMASAPLTAHWGNRFAPAALLGNLLVMPSAYVIVLTALLSLVSATVFPWVSETFNHANRVFAHLLMSGIAKISAIPGLQMNVRAPPLWAIGLIYATLAGALHLRGRPRAVLLAATTLVVGAVVVHTASDARVTVHALDSGRGSAVLIEGPRASTVLFDAGPRHRSYALTRYLREQGVNRLDAVVLTRADADRAGALPELMGRFRVRQVFHPAVSSRSPVYAAALAEARAAGAELIPFGRNAHVFLADGAELDGYHPDASERYRRAADAALAIRWAHGAAAVLVVGSTSPEVRSGVETASCDAAAPLFVVTAPLDGDVLASLIHLARPRAVIVRGPLFHTVPPDESLEGPNAPSPWRDANDPGGVRFRIGDPPLIRPRPGPAPMREAW
jgi:ComEC/Rec2-related protein